MTTLISWEPAAGEEEVGGKPGWPGPGVPTLTPPASFPSTYFLSLRLPADLWAPGSARSEPSHAPRPPRLLRLLPRSPSVPAASPDRPRPVPPGTSISALAAQCHLVSVSSSKLGSPAWRAPHPAHLEPWHLIQRPAQSGPCTRPCPHGRCRAHFHRFKSGCQKV